MTVTPGRPLPYVGPRPFDRDDADRFFGRDQEVNDLFDLMIARRLVLLHSPSGAGKSSLIQAKLIPRLAEEGLVINPTVRVSAIEAVGLGPNRYLTATLLALGASLQPGAEVPTLAAYLEGRSPSPAAEVFIFDQFEEVLTADPLDELGREEFFRQLGVALNDDRRWACFALREDHLGALRPLLRHLPTRLNTTFRLKLLSSVQAREALQEPAAMVGVEFTQDAAERLVDDLRRTIVSTARGSVRPELGLTVEPVQLQVVALRLWQQRFGTETPPPQSVITVADVERMGDVNRVLADYYSEEIASIVRATGASERAIRTWFTEELITRDGRRDQVLRQEEQSGGLSNELINRLINAYLVRSEERRGALWLELTHDRLIDPIRESNQAWFEERLTTFQKQAALWAAEGRSESLLLRAKALSEAERWAAEHADEMTEDEDGFLRESRKEEAARAREERRTRALLATALVVAMIMTLLTVYAFAQGEQARDAARNAQVRQFAAKALAEGKEQPQRSLLVALEAVGESDVDAQSRQIAEQSLRATLEIAGGLPLRGHEGAVHALAFSPDGKWIATGSEDTTVRLWSSTNLQIPQVLPGHGRPVVALSFSEDSSQLYSASQDGTVLVWQVARSAETPRILKGHQGAIVAMASDPMRGLLLTASEDRSVRLWDVTQSEGSSQVLEGHLGEITAVGFSPDGQWIASTDSDGQVLLRRVDQPVQILARLSLEGSSATATALSFSPDSRLLAVGGTGSSGGPDGAAWVWEVHEGEQQPTVYGGHSQIVQDVTFAPDGETLATMSLDGTARLWTLGKTDSPIADLRSHTGRVMAGSFSPNGEWLATASDDHTARLWLVDAPATEPIVLRGHAGYVTDVRFSVDNRRLLTASEDGTARLWQVGLAGVTPEVRSGHTGEPASVVPSPDGRWIASAGFSEPTFLWSLAERGGAPLVLDDKRFVSGLAFSPDSTLLFAGDLDSPVIRRWGVSGEQWRSLPPLTSTVAAGRLALSPNGSSLIAAGVDGSLAAFRLGEDDSTPVVWTGPEARVLALAVAPEGNWAATSVEDGRLLLWDLTAPSIAKPFPLVNHGPLIRALRFSPDGQLLAAGGDDGRVRIYQVDDREAEPIELVGSDGTPAHNGSVTTVAFNPTISDQIATGSADGIVFVWRISAPDKADQELKHSSYVLDLVFSTSGELLATGSEDRLVRVYTLSQPASEPVLLRAHTDKVTKLAFLQDGRLLSASPDKRIMLWDIGVDRLRELACEAAGRNLSPQEWSELYDDSKIYTKTCLRIAAHPDTLVAHLQRISLEDALNAYEVEYRLDPTLEPPSAWLVRTSAKLFDLGRSEIALEAFARAQARETRLVSADTKHLNKICIDAARVNLQAALAACNAAVARNPIYGTYRYNRANVWKALDDKHKELSDLKAFVAWADANPVTDVGNFVAESRQRITELEAQLISTPSPTP